MYYLVDWQKSPDGKCPKLPKDVDFLLLAQPFPHADYGLFRADLSHECSKYLQIEPVAERLACLLDSAKSYPPALALSRDEVEELEMQSRKAFIDALIAQLQFHLEDQRSSLYFLARSKTDEGVYRRAGTYYWIVGYHKDRLDAEIAWVSDDDFVYHDAVAEFDIDPSWMAKRFEVSQDV